MSRFPKVSETFILYELLAVEQHGASVEVFPLLRERQDVVHPEAAAVAARAHYFPFLSLALVASNGRAFLNSPARYLTALWEVLRGTWGSLNFMVGAAGIFPKVVHAARLMEQLGVEHVHCHFATHPAVAGLVI